MENVVYILGAGFSQPLGLPVMRDFLIRSRDLCSGNAQFAHLQQVLDTVGGMSFVKNYYEADLFNIEEVLSILDMEDAVTGADRSRVFAEYIKTVIMACTPPMAQPSFGGNQSDRAAIADNAHELIFGQSPRVWTSYGHFVGNLLNLALATQTVADYGRNTRKLLYYERPSPDCNYAVVTLNYDLIIETCIKRIAERAQPRSEKSSNMLASLRLAKLHGSVDGSIVAPTWRKWAVAGVREHWALAHELLRSATQIRILGYSLPVSDSYVRYLLESAVTESQNLKCIDVICLDDADAHMRKHYREYVSFKFFRFKNANVSDYIDFRPSHSPRLVSRSTVDIAGQSCPCFLFDRLEEGHASFMGS